MRLKAIALILIVDLMSPLLAAQKPPQLEDAAGVQRPNLAAHADTNSWEAYFDYGVAHLRDSPRLAEAAFVWAAKIDPTRAEPLFGRWVAYWRRFPGWFEDYLKDVPAVVESPRIVQVDSLFWRALLRNPFVPRHLAVLLYEQLPGTWGHDRYTTGLLAYSAGRYDQAVANFGGLLRSDSVKHYQVRFDLALCYTATRRFDSAAVQVAALLAEMRRRSEARLTYFYESRELYQYSLGLLHRALGAIPTARADLGEALVQNLGFYPAHAELGEVALAEGDKPQAVAEYAQAADLGANDGVMHYRYALALHGVGRIADAEVELQRAVTLEPFYAAPYFVLAQVLESRGNIDGAVKSYRQYLERTERGDPQIEMTRARIAALEH